MDVNNILHTHIFRNSWAGALMRKPLGIQKNSYNTDVPTD